MLRSPSLPVGALTAGLGAVRRLRATPDRGSIQLGTVGGIVYPLVYSAQFLPDLHTGYSIVGASMIPIVLLAAWVFQPRIASVANEDGFTSDSGATAPADD